MRDWHYARVYSMTSMTNEEIEAEVKKWLKENPECPPDIREWITRTDPPPIGKAYVLPQDKLRYMRAHAFVKETVKVLPSDSEHPGKVKVQLQRVNSIEEAMQILLKENENKRPS